MAPMEPGDWYLVEIFQDCLPSTISSVLQGIVAEGWSVLINSARVL